MPRTGDQLIVTFNSMAPLSWGSRRYRNTRTRRTGERYIPIPRKDAKRLKLYNSNWGTELGINIFNVHSSDGIFNGQLKTAGCSRRGDVYAKQFQGNGDLRSLEPWLRVHQAQVGDQVRFVWLNRTDIEMTFISNHN